MSNAFDAATTNSNDPNKMPSPRSMQKQMQREAHYEQRRASLERHGSIVSTDSLEQEKHQAHETHHRSGLRSRLVNIARQMVTAPTRVKEGQGYDIYVCAGDGRMVVGPGPRR